MQEGKQNFTGIWLPREVLCSPGLTPSEKILYANIASFHKCCFESNERLADKCGIDQRTVRRGLNALEGLGFIVIEFINGNTSKRRIYAILDNPKKIQYLVKKGLFQQVDSKNNREEDGSFPQTGQNVRSQDEIGQNVQSTGQNVRSHNSGETGQNVHQRKIRIKEEKEVSDVAADDGRATDPPRPRPKQSDYKDHDSYVKALYAWNMGAKIN